MTARTVLVVCQGRRGELLDSSLSALAAGAALVGTTGGRLVVAVLGTEAAPLVGQLPSLPYNDIVFAPIDEGFDASQQVDALEALCAEIGPDVVLFGHSTDAMAVAPALAARQGLGLATDVIGVDAVEGEIRAKRAVFEGRLVEVVGLPRERSVLTVRGGSYAVPPGSATPPPVRELHRAPSSGDTVHAAWKDPENSGVDITKADLLVSVGRPIGSADNVARVDRLATSLGGVMSASRPVVDAGWADASRQVGQTGRTVKPRVYLALGISGAVQHASGMAGSGTVIAVNTDSQAPILDRADYAAHIDMFELLDALEDQVGGGH